VLVFDKRTNLAYALHRRAHTCKGKKERQSPEKENPYLMLGITRIHRYVRPLSATPSAASGREFKANAITRLASKLTTLLCTPRAVAPYLWVAPQRPPVDRLPPT